MRKAICIIASLLIGMSAFAQMRDVVEVVSADRNKLAGCEGPYRFENQTQTPAPKGYTPFYISHYGRHGSRYAWNPATYTKIKEMLDAAKEANALTEKGQKLYDDFTAFYMTPYVNTGDLSELGWEQHTRIAQIMYQNFPEVFRNGGKVLARASTIPRAIVSMEAFVTSLQKCAPLLDIEANSLHTNLPVTNAGTTPREIATRYEGRIPVPERGDVYRKKRIDYDGILGSLFTDRGWLEEKGGRTDFICELFNLWAGYHNYTDENFMEDIFTPEQILALWDSENYNIYIGHSGGRYQQISLLQDVLDNADEAIKTGVYKAHLRFGHDTVVNAFYPLINLNGSAYTPENPEDAKYYFQNFKTPMAANIQFVLFRSKKDPEILFKVLQNGEEATLPQLTPVSGPYYKWADFVSWANQLIKDHPRMTIPETPRRRPF